MERLQCCSNPTTSTLPNANLMRSTCDQCMYAMWHEIQSFDATWNHMPKTRLRYVVTLLNWVLVFEWYVVRFVVIKSGCTKDTCYNSRLDHVL